MESAIPRHLSCPRLQPARAPADYMPSYAAWTARLSTDVRQLTMAYFGVQWRAGVTWERAREVFATLTRFFQAAYGPGHVDVGEFTDTEQVPAFVAMAYWDEPGRYVAWTEMCGIETWLDEAVLWDEEIGIFREVFSPRASCFETIFSTPDKFEGAGNLAQAISGEFREHGYWGGMRDRLAASQLDPLQAEGALSYDMSSNGRRVRVRGHANVAVIRSGQDWSETRDEERRLYLEEVEPVLRQGMEFLRSAGAEIGCYQNRSVTLLDAAGKRLEKTFSMSCWHDLEQLEDWASSHPTHLAIYGTFMSMVEAMNNKLKLRLYHEVVVLEAREQFYEYINCHDRTGLLRAAGFGAVQAACEVAQNAAEKCTTDCSPRAGDKAGIGYAY